MCVIILIFLVIARTSPLDEFHVDNQTVLFDKDGDPHNVHASHDNKKGAAMVSEKIKVSLFFLMQHLQVRFGDDNSIMGDYTRRILFRYAPETVVENSPHNTNGSTSYCAGKGSRLALCIRNKNDPRKFVAHNELMFVAIHEISHIAVREMHHPPEFWVGFKRILAEAVKAGVYSPIDYSKHPFDYCGLPTRHNPLFDPSIRV